MNKQANILKSRVFGSLDVIEKASFETAKAWDKKSKSIPIDLFGAIITKAKWKLHPTNEYMTNAVKIANNYIRNYNKMIGLLETSAIKTANSFKSDSIKLDYITESIKVLKNAFISGTKQSNNVNPRK